ncbi:MAG: hypothetical protein NVSMB45_01050 [Ginsengibacter sp.]
MNMNEELKTVTLKFSTSHDYDAFKEYLKLIAAQTNDLDLIAKCKCDQTFIDLARTYYNAEIVEN